MAFTNKYPGKCGKCGGRVAAGAGLCEKVNGKFTAFHGSCGAGPVEHPRHPAAAPGEPGCRYCGCPEFHDGEECPVAAAAEARKVAKVSTVFRTSGGTFYRNARGKCEDAPCCGCCTF